MKNNDHPTQVTTPISCIYCTNNPGTNHNGVWKGFLDADTGKYVCNNCQQQHYNFKFKNPEFRNKYSEMPVMVLSKIKVNCKHCGCHDHDACYHPKLGNCWWVTENECSHCIEVPGKALRYSQLPAGIAPDQLEGAYQKCIKKKKTR